MEQNDENGSARGHQTGLLSQGSRGGWAGNTALGKGNEPQLPDSKLQLREGKVRFLNQQQDLKCAREENRGFPPALLVQDSLSFME